jgi:hypothetical protein
MGRVHRLVGAGRLRLDGGGFLPWYASPALNHPTTRLCRE